MGMHPTGTLLFASEARPFICVADILGQPHVRRLLGGLRVVGRLLLRSPRVDVHSCVKHDDHGEIHVRWSVRGTWRLVRRKYALEAMSVYVVNEKGVVSYHRCAMPMCRTSEPCECVGTAAAATL